MIKFNKNQTNKKTSVRNRGFVPSAGIEPAHLAVLEFESSASTNSANWAALNWCANIELFFIS